MTTAATDRHPTPHAPALTRPFPPPTPARLREALTVLASERAPGADYRPEDRPVITAWEETRARCADDDAAALHHLDAFLALHLDGLRDLSQRARHGRGPTTFLDEIERTLNAYA